MKTFLFGIKSLDKKTNVKCDKHVYDHPALNELKSDVFQCSFKGQEKPKNTIKDKTKGVVQKFFHKPHNDKAAGKCEEHVDNEQLSKDLRAKIQEIFGTNEDFKGKKWLLNNKESLLNSAKNVYSLKVLYEILTKPPFYNNAKFMQWIPYSLDNINTQEKAEARIQVIDKIASSPALYENEDFMKSLDSHICRVRSYKDAEVKNLFLDKIISEPKLHNNSDFMKIAHELVVYSDRFMSDNIGLRDAKERIKVIDKILSKPILSDNKGFMKGLWSILQTTSEKDEAKWKIKLINRVTSDPILSQNEEFINNFGNSLTLTRNSLEYEMQNKILDIITSNPSLYKNKTFMKYASDFGGVCRHYKSKRANDYIRKFMGLLDAMLANGRFDDEDFIEQESKLITSVRCFAALELASNIMSNPNLLNSKALMSNIYSVMECAYDAEPLKFIREIISRPELYNNANLMSHLSEITKKMADNCFYENNEPNRIAKTQVMIKISESKNKILNDNLGEILSEMYPSETAEAKILILDKILSEPKLYENPDFMQDAAEIIKGSHSRETAETKIKVIDKILPNPEFYNSNEFMKNAGKIVLQADSAEICELVTGTLDLILSNKLCKNEKFMAIAHLIIKYANSTQRKEFVGKLLSDNDFLNNFDNIYQDAEELYSKVLEHPDLYTNGEFEKPEEAVEEVEKFFNKQKPFLIFMLSVFDKETMNTLLRMRFDDAEEYINSFKNLDYKDITMLKDICSLNNANSEPLTPLQKIQFIDLIEAYKRNGIDTLNIQEEINKGSIDIDKLNRNLFVAILKNCGIKDDEISEISPEKLMGWDARYTHLLSKEMESEKDPAYTDLFRASNLNDFMRYIQDSSNKYGKVNEKTKRMFEDKGLNYTAWIAPSKSSEVKFIAKDKNTEQLAQFANQLTEDIEHLRQTPAVSLINKQFNEFIKDDKFQIPAEYIKNKTKLEDFIKNLLTQLDGVFKRAKNNKDNPNKKQTAELTMTIESHIRLMLEGLSKISNSKSAKTLDLTIKMWDRIPQKDLFQGNYSTCCIGMGGGNGSAMPHYLLNTSYNMIELVDKSGKVIGNALCYFVADKNGKPAFIVDNIEIKNSEKPSDEIGIELRNKIAEYAHNIAYDVTGDSDTKVYMSSNYNDVPTQDLKCVRDQVTFLGDTDCESIYMDLYDGWAEKSNDKYVASFNMLEL